MGSSRIFLIVTAFSWVGAGEGAGGGNSVRPFFTELLRIFVLETLK